MTYQYIVYGIYKLINPIFQKSDTIVDCPPLISTILGCPPF